MKNRAKRVSKKTPSWRSIFDNPQTPFFNLFHNFLALTTLVAVSIVALETVESFQGYGDVFLYIEYFSVIIFGFEYIARVYLAQNKVGYIFSFFGLIDIIAIIPSLLGLSNFTFLKAARSIRIIRMLRMLRLAKFSQIKRRKNAAQSLYKINLEIYIAALSTAVLLLGSLFYIFEQHGGAKDIPSGMYWALKVILGGISYPQPETIGGTITLIMARFTSMILLGMMLSLVGTMIRKLLIGAEKDS
jgi:voltage-gated potassium channel